MRQAGRVLPEYRAARKSFSLETLYSDPDVAARLTALPVERFGVDAAQVATDIRLPLLGMGLIDRLSEGEGPGRATPRSNWPRNWRAARSDDFGQVMETVRLAVRALAGQVDVMAVVGAPFTLAASALDPGSPASPSQTTALVYGSSDRWHELASALCDAAIRSSELQVSAGASVVHVFDTWAGALDEPDYRAHVLPWSRRLFDAIAALGVPSIHFALGSEHLLEAFRDGGGDVLGIDARLPIDAAWARVGPQVGLQGNLDPTLLVGPVGRALEATEEILARAGNRPGFVFGLSHGLLPSTPSAVLHTLVRYIHRHHS
jgi:uroporphyrinogen decarboxylase